MKKQILKTKNILTVLIISLVFISVASSRISALTPSPVPAICFNPQTSLAYYCGSAAPLAANDSSASKAQQALDSNYATQTLVVEKDKAGTYQATKSNLVSGSTDFGLYTLNNGECYIYETVPSGPDAGRYAWVGNQDCTADAYQNPVAQPMSSQIAGSLGQVQSCSKNGDTANCNLFQTYINPLISFLNIAVGLVVVISIVIGGIQYSAAGDNPNAVKAARQRIINALLGLVAYLLLYTFLNFIIPGGA
ncbi:MAG TPA: hypothetical protein VII94_01355 [Candidatus Saccharimonadales bacterium]